MPSSTKARSGKIVRATVTDKPREPTPQEQARTAALAALDALGGITVTEEDLIWRGDKIILPEAMEPELAVVIETLTQRMKDEEEEFDFTRTYPYRPYDGAAAFQRALIRAFGVSPAGKAWKDMFGQVHRPTYISVNAGVGKTMQVPWDTFKLDLLDAEFSLGYNRMDGGIVFELTVTAPRKHRKRIEALFHLVEIELRERSIYRGHALSGDDGVQMSFFDPYTLDRARIVYNSDVMEQLEANVWTPVQHADLIRELGMPLRRAILLEGPNGTGKTSAGSLTAQHAVQNGWTFILVKKGEDPLSALATARQYAPAVVWYEDIDDLAAGKSRGEVSRLMDVLDNVQNKNADVIAIFTSNFAEKIEKGVLRPGRIDAVIHVDALDADGAERLIRALLPAGMLDASTDFARVGDACEGYLPAFLTEVVGRAVRYAIAREQGRPDSIKTSDLVQAAEGLRPQLELMLEARSTHHESPPLERALNAWMENALSGMKLNSNDLRFVTVNHG
jgi:hypothetical protein